MLLCVAALKDDGRILGKYGTLPELNGDLSCETRRGMARERRGAGSSVVSIETV